MLTFEFDPNLDFYHFFSFRVLLFITQMVPEKILSFWLHWRWIMVNGLIITTQ